MQDYEKLGVFYLGREVAPDTRKPTGELLLYPSPHLTTHALCVGMTGSGKTGLCIGLLEEAAIDGVPVLAIDPKGDLANLALTFPALDPASFAAWVDPAEAERKGLSVDELGGVLAKRWREGLAEHHQTPERIQRLRDAAEVTVYTPGSRAGVPLALLPSFDPPGDAVLEDGELFTARVAASASALLGLVGLGELEAQSPEQVLLAQLLSTAWSEGRGLSLAELIVAVQRPGFDRIGVFDLESFFPAKERTSLALKLNALLAAPGASTWTQGEPLDIARLMFTAAGKPRISIISIAHLDDAQRMFFVTTLLGELIGWMRAQSGTSSLRALFYMDEIFGYFPPVAAPPSKAPMLLLLKQARAFGLGVVLATQNPVDLDYKGLSNCGTWWIGRLQTERDKLRVLDGLEGAVGSAGGALDRAALDRTLSGLGNRVFLMHSVHAGAPRLFETRWTLSFLRGPMTREELKKLGTKSPRIAATVAPPVESASAPRVAPSAASAPRAAVPADVPELFVPAAPGDGPITYRPALLAVAKAHYVQAKSGLDAWRTWTLLLPLAEDAERGAWEEAEVLDVEVESWRQAAPDARFEPAPALISGATQLAREKKAVAAHIYEARPLVLLTAPALKLSARPDEAAPAFHARVQLALREARDAQVEKLTRKLEPKLAALDEKLRRAEAKIEKEKSEASAQTVDAALSMGSTILGALFGRKVVSSANLGRARSTMRSASQTMKQRQDVSQAEETHAALLESREALEAELEAGVQEIQAQLAADAAPVEETPVAPRKADTSVALLAVAWIPHRTGEDGALERCAQWSSPRRR